jgi:hypothetical protein
MEMPSTSCPENALFVLKEGTYPHFDAVAANFRSGAPTGPIRARSDPVRIRLPFPSA